MALFRKILVPHDFSNAASRALRVAVQLARRQRGRIVLLHVVVPVQPLTGFPGGEGALWLPHTESVAGVRRRLERLAARLTSPRGAPRIECRVVVGNAVDGILRAARRTDSIVMATMGRSGLAHLLIGSVAERVVRHSPVPVLTVRPERRRR